MRKFLLVGAFVCLAAFVMLSKFEDRAALRALDLAVTVKIQDRIDRSVHLRLAQTVDTVMTGATFFAGPSFSVLAILVFTVLDMYQRKRNMRWIRSFVIPLGFVLIILAELYGKSVVHHPSPAFSLVKHPTTIFPQDYINEQFSYPSGHAARAIYLAVIAVMLWVNRRAAGMGSGGVAVIFIAMAYVALVCVSKIYLGQHWFSDIAGGLLIGAAFGLSAPLLAGPTHARSAIDARGKATYNRKNNE